jgi:hypothetical protein
LVNLQQAVASRALGSEFEPEPRDAADDKAIANLLARLGPPEWELIRAGYRTVLRHDFASFAERVFFNWRAFRSRRGNGLRLD